MRLRHFNQVLGVKLVHANLFGCFRLPDLGGHVTDPEGRADGKSLVEVLDGTELSDSLGLALEVAKGFDIVEVGKLVLGKLTFGDLLDLFLKIAKVLLSHHGIVALVSGRG